MPQKHSTVDYFYLSCPWIDQGHFQIQACPWISQTRSRAQVPIDDMMTFQGSLWFTTANHFHNRIGGLEEKTYRTVVAESLEIGMKTWLGGGRVIINKNTWYAHLHKGFLTPNYPRNTAGQAKDLIYAARYWTENRWPHRVHDFDWLIDKFWPLPTAITLSHREKYYWPENWLDLYLQK